MADQRFLSRLRAADGGCLLWCGSRDKDGYGMVHRDGRTLKAHRYAWVLRNGPIPTGQSVLHRCDKPSCCNPDHLFLGTQQDNIRDMAQKDRHGATKITMQEAQQIRNMVATGPRGTAATLARKFGVSPSCISKIVNGLQRV